MAESLRIEPVRNFIGDRLPVIPIGTELENGRVRYQVKLLATLLNAEGKPIQGRPLDFESSRKADVVRTDPPTTGPDGTLYVIIKTRQDGPLLIRERSGSLGEFRTIIGPAWWEEEFRLTAYVVCDENDFSGELVFAKGLDEKHREDFLFSARGVCMEGTGRGINGKFIAYVTGGKWTRNQRNNPVWIEDPQDVQFEYVGAPRGKFGELRDGISVAIDPNIVPPRARLHINTVGDRIADDIGGGIKGNHIDVYIGMGTAGLSTWTNRSAAVKFLGYDESALIA